jgi:3-phosphoshikimate 1-carboxyvinyltransferase
MHASPGRSDSAEILWMMPTAMPATMKKDFLDLPAASSARGTLRLPGSKSISNRVLLLAALAKGDTLLHDLLSSDDVDRMLDALRSLAVDWRHAGGNDYRVCGTAGQFAVREADLFLGNAGTAFRPLTAVLALMGGQYRLHGVPRMHERPIGDLVDALRQAGAHIEYEGKDGFPPLRIHPARALDVPSVSVRGDVSSQFLTGLLMALPLTGRAVRIDIDGELISKPYVDITLALMRQFGVAAQRDGWSSIQLPAVASYESPGECFVEGDASSASYFLAAGAIGGGPVRVEGVGRDSVQGDVAFAQALEQLGAIVRMGPNWMEASAPSSGRLRAFDLDLNHIPDAAMTLAICALFAEGPSRLRNIASWRVKETDRIAAMAIELRKLGAMVEEGADYLSITPPDTDTLCPGASIDTYDDHRMAMCFSLVTLGGVPVRIMDPGCVAKTFPDYFDRWAEVAR